MRRASPCAVFDIAGLILLESQKVVYDDQVGKIGEPNNIASSLHMEPLNGTEYPA
jgi:hypothetical protein